jgi:hypothetical protein
VFFMRILLQRLAVATTVLSGLLIGAHFLRSGVLPLVALGLAFPLLLAVRRRWATVVVQLALLLAAAEWTRTLGAFYQVRRADGAPWVRMAVILGAVALIAVASAILIHGRDSRRE